MVQDILSHQTRWLVSKGFFKVFPGHCIKSTRHVKKQLTASIDQGSFDPGCFHLASVIFPLLVKSLDRLDMSLHPGNGFPGPPPRKVGKLGKPSHGRESVFLGFMHKQGQNSLRQWSLQCYGTKCFGFNESFVWLGKQDNSAFPPFMWNVSSTHPTMQASQKARIQFLPPVLSK